MQEEFEYHDRDLSWLSFNYRILLEAADANVPLYDRLKFIAIYSSNLDEFFRVRVASIRSVREIGKKKLNEQLDMKPKKLLKQIMAEVNQQLQEYGATLREEILPGLREAGVHLYFGEPLAEEHFPAINYYFRTRVLAFLKPVFLDVEQSERLFLKNRAIYFALKLQSMTEESVIRFAFVNIPSDELSRFLQLPQTDGEYHFVTLDDIIRANLDLVFPDYRVLNCSSIKLNKDADLNIEDEYDGDLIEKINKQITKRDIGVPSRFLFDAGMPEDLQSACSTAFGLSKQDMVAGGRYHNLNDLMKLPNPKGKELESARMKPLPYQPLDQAHSIFEAIAASDHMLHFPYHSYDYVLRFFNEAAIDPAVRAIKVTLYRIAASSLIAHALISAAKNGKEVIVFVEVKARFDEENNLRWARKMQEAGIQIIYSMPGLKVHAKVALVQREEQGQLSGYAFLGTGNFNEDTASIYSDSGLLTNRQELTTELEQVFYHLCTKEAPSPFEHLLVSQFNIQERFLAAIDAEIAAAKEGQTARIMVKVNNLEDKVMIDRLYEASRAGVQIDMLIRTICCLKPEVAGYSDNIKITRVVDSYLEHARVWAFHNGGDARVYLGSADWMKRNLYHRIEVVYPVYDAAIKAEIMHLTDLQFADNAKAAWLSSELANVRKTPREGEEARTAQASIYAYLRAKTEAHATVS